MGSEQVEMEQEARPQSLEEALVTHLQQVRELEERLFRQYEREEAVSYTHLTLPTSDLV